MKILRSKEMEKQDLVKCQNTSCFLHSWKIIFLYTKYNLILLTEPIFITHIFFKISINLFLSE